MQGTAERRGEIMKILCQRRNETIRNLAFEFGVSERTIRRDIEILSLTEPIYTQPGRYGGGVYVDERYSMQRMYMTKEELRVLQKLADMVDRLNPCELGATEKNLLHSIIATYAKPQSEKENEVR
jgi:predicted DNA-binding transcriptional regulator YafY